MIRANFCVVLDACVLANYAVCDVFLRLAEGNCLYLPRWSEKILAETKNTQLTRLGWPSGTVDSFHAKIREAFPEAVVCGYEDIQNLCRNDPKDRHVLACAVHCKAEVIVTFNLKDFPKDSLSPWGIEALHPQQYLSALYSMEPVLVLHTLETISRRRNRELQDYLIDLGKFLPSFSRQILEDLKKSS